MKIPDMVKSNHEYKWKAAWLERVYTMNKIYECEKCGVVTHERDHLCVPKSVDNMDSYCGSAGNDSQMCESIRKKAEYTCTICGRTAEKAELVCDTVKLH